MNAVAPHPDALFDADWLSLRRAADSAARSTVLEAALADWLARRQTAGDACRLIDLGCGSGANLLHLAPRLPGPQHWLLVDHDAALLARARVAADGVRAACGRPVRADTLHCDLRHLSAEAFAGVDAVTASALLDLVDEGWLRAQVGQCVAAGTAVLCALSVDGQWSIGPESDPDDAPVREAFNAHQMRDKGLGAALGPRAAGRLAALFDAAGWHVQQAASPWRLDCADPAMRALCVALLAGWHEAALAQQPTMRARFDAWHARRLARARAASLRIDVGHIDLLAIPPSA